MPWYRIEGVVVHLRGRNLPPPCVATVDIGGVRQRCGALSSYLCDWPTHGKTCSAGMCALHAWQMAPDQHVCPLHLEQHMAQRQGLFTQLMTEG